ncbi:hypothetical protein GCM10023188_16600 [Pontibacter saemangeumensis]|uniref:Uncharacterized protein n=1 Tax=Pontibacter saemangeumensis TaxID=1084525 RepID=A0ABP8LK06_9BACT
MSYFDGSEGEAIPLDEAAAFTANYRRSHGDKAETVKAHFFGRDILQKILEQEGCAGIRMYYGLDGSGEKQLVLVGVDADGQDMEDGLVADRSRVCPPDCAVGALNG